MPSRKLSGSATLRIPRLSRDILVRLGLIVSSAVLVVLGFIGFGFFPLMWVALVPALVAIREQPPGYVFGYGMVLGTLANFGGYYWMAHMLRDFGGLPSPVAWLGLFLLCLYQGGIFALLLWAVRHGEDRLGLAPIWTLAVAYPAVEFLYPLVFPYSIGASQYRFSAITQIVEVTGLLGLTVLIGLVNGGIYELVSACLAYRKPELWRLAVPAVLFTVVLTYGVVRIPQIDRTTAAAAQIKVALVQTNLGAGNKAADPESFVRLHQALSRSALAAHPDVHLIVWPETAYNRWLPRDQRNMRDVVTRGIDRPMIWGALTYRRRPNGDFDAFNTAFLTSTAGDVLASYDKSELVLFGERIPLADTFPRIRSWFPRSSTFTPGESPQYLRFGTLTFLPTICYEDILPALVRRLWQSGGPANILVNLTNDSWYGDSHEPLIHLALASFRAIETRRALIRSTNTGISALVDPVGRITARSGQWRREVLVGDVAVIEPGASTLYMRFGDIVGWLASGGALVGIVIARRARNRVRRP
jgi:apolipoprotein N-acyltransferase